MLKRQDDLGYLQIRRAPPVSRNLWLVVFCGVTGYQSAVVGVVGEHLARARLQALGWQVPDGDFLGGTPRTEI